MSRANNKTLSLYKMSNKLARLKRKKNARKFSSRKILHKSIIKINKKRLSRIDKDRNLRIFHKNNKSILVQITSNTLKFTIKRFSKIVLIMTIYNQLRFTSKIFSSISLKKNKNNNKMMKWILW
jgi:hypothetical protein